MHACFLRLAALRFALTIGAGLSLHGPAHAADRSYDVANPVYRAECANCHVPFPPELLSHGAWDTVLDHLDHHYGRSLNLDARTIATLRAYLTGRADRSLTDLFSFGVEPPRISTAGWFTRAHRKVAPQVRQAGIGSWSNCGACHREASHGDYERRNIHLPR